MACSEKAPESKAVPKIEPARTSITVDLPLEKTDAAARLFLESALQDGRRAWFRAEGRSMFPFFHPGEKIGLAPVSGPLEVGQVVAASDGENIKVHRLLERLPREQTWLMKGDFRVGFDRPVRSDDILGVVDRVERKGRIREIGPSPALAALSLKLGRFCGGVPGRSGSRIAGLIYQAIFLPAALWIRISPKKESHGQPDDNHRL